MARTRLIISSTWQEVNGGAACIITVANVTRDSPLEINQVDDDPETVTAIMANPNDQFEQTEAKSVFMRSALPGYQVVVDTQG